jgi:hypothetical protein
MENWGRAGRWTDPDVAGKKSRTSFDKGMPRMEDKYADRDFVSEEQMAEDQEKRQEGKLYMPDVNAMSGKEFDRYLETIRRDKGKYLGQKVAALKESMGKKAIDLEREATLVGIATRGHTSKSDPAHFQATLSHQQVSEQGSTKLHSTSHKMHGLTYSPPSSTSSIVPGQIMNRMNSFGNSGNNNNGQRYQRFQPAEDANRSWVVSVGGLTGSLPNAMSTRDANQIKAVDYTRQNPAQGQGSFELRKAHLITPATVSNLQQSNQSARWAGRYQSVSGAKQPSPLDTFTFDIELQEDKASTSTVLPGSKEWVGRDNSKLGLKGSEESVLGFGGLGIGGPRNERNRGETLQYLSSLQGRNQREADRELKDKNQSVASDLVERLRGLGGLGGGQQG